MNKSNNMTGKQVYPIEHTHILVFACLQQDRCEGFEIYECNDKLCGYWEERNFSHNSNKCELQVTRFSTRTTCLECSKCGRKEIEHS